MTPLFSSTLSALFVTFIFVFENSQNSFSCGLPFGLFWSVKYLSFGQKLPIGTAHYAFLTSKLPEVTKNPYYVLSLLGSQKWYKLMDYYSFLNPLSANITKWSNTLKQFVGKLPTLFWDWRLKG